MQTSTVLITGVSSGIGWHLADQYLRRGWQVFGVSRRAPEELLDHPQMAFAALDVTDHNAVKEVLPSLLGDVEELSLAVLNAGILGQFGDMRQMPLDKIHQVMDVNLWANKAVLDTIFATVKRVQQVVTISSGASVNGHRGWAGYSISKAALNMMTKLYAGELPETHFCAFAPGVADTAMQDKICGLPDDERYPSIANLKSRRGTDEMKPPEDVAPLLIEAMSQLPQLVKSGDYADIRQLEISEPTP